MNKLEYSNKLANLVGDGSYNKRKRIDLKDQEETFTDPKGLLHNEEI